MLRHGSGECQNRIFFGRIRAGRERACLFQISFPIRGVLQILLQLRVRFRKELYAEISCRVIRRDLCGIAIRKPAVRLRADDGKRGKAQKADDHQRNQNESSTVSEMEAVFSFLLPWAFLFSCKEIVQSTVFEGKVVIHDRNPLARPSRRQHRSA